MKTYEVHYSFLLDGAKVKMFHKTILSSVTHVAHPLVTPSLQTPYYGSKFPISGIIIFCTLRQTTRPSKNAAITNFLLFTCEHQSNQGGNFFPYDCLIYKSLQQRVSDTDNMSLIPSKIDKPLICLSLLKIFNLLGILSKNLKFEDDS